MENFVARQPIFDQKQKVYGYELLFRSGLDNYFQAVDGDKATSRVIANSFLLFGIETMTEGAKAFINFTRSLLVKEYALILPKAYTVVEILEDVEPDDEVLNACQNLKDRGFLLALDDFVYDPKFEPLLELADIVKVDFTLSGPDERRRLADAFLPLEIKLLAEKVETLDEFEQAAEMGYSYFQGYFFAKPVVVARKDVPGFKVSFFRMLSEANRPELDFERLSDMVRSEMSVSYKLLKLVNSAAYAPIEEITGIKQALGYLGENGVRKWMSLLALSGMAEDKPDALVVSSLVRAKFCELLAEKLGAGHRAADLFLMGLFSQLDAIIGRPLPELLAELPLAKDVVAALSGQHKLTRVLQLAVALEKGRWDLIPKLSAAVGLQESDLPEAFYEAVQWPKEVFSEL